MPTTAPTVELAHGAAMPLLGLGTWPMDDAEAERVVAEAIGLGYRLVDTAENYKNERGVGLGVKASGVAREELFVTTKFNKEWHGVELAAEACARGLDRLGLDYLDLLLIHWPNPDQGKYIEAWQGLVRLLESGRVKAIGTSNFKPAHLDRIIEATGVIPDVNQIQLSPLTTRLETRAYHKERGIVTQSWSPIGGEGGEVRNEPKVLQLAEKYGKTPVQVVLRWHLDSGLAVVPKSSDPERLAQNLDVFDFQLEPDDVMALAALDQGEAAAADSDAFGH
ncbi:aldo/keto reductase [Glycomyces algeriensis]|uniref:Oxidoreductase n=1 Tax=Glycomyces algeriensis TaxID=256037 RepID=A0A9W6G5W6_9ACTN|nr:aldo/keto reductase [Glycomyces algeriensis]MDA1367220.1 aldo/keto reductase [Glycomyces algeriensis]MDR7353396.1 2,5-diketo-D-gluconate reductase A [Glycomyces algeriensis]GLI41091.1 putative oxidoreductase [Glycomyces algeriensis]